MLRLDENVEVTLELEYFEIERKQGGEDIPFASITYSTLVCDCSIKNDPCVED